MIDSIHFGVTQVFHVANTFLDVELYFMRLLFSDDDRFITPLELDIKFQLFTLYVIILRFLMY